jgi:hypothetical protein
MNKKRSESNGGEAKAKPEIIKSGLDLHAPQVTECRQLNGSMPKPAQKRDPWKSLDQIVTRAYVLRSFHIWMARHLYSFRPTSSTHD